MIFQNTAVIDMNYCHNRPGGSRDNNDNGRQIASAISMHCCQTRVISTKIACPLLSHQRMSQRIKIYCWTFFLSFFYYFISVQGGIGEAAHQIHRFGRRCFNWTFFASCYGWGATSEYRVRAVARSFATAKRLTLWGECLTTLSQLDR